MGDTYKHDAEGVASIVSSLKNTINDYKDKVIEITNLVNTINGSTSWKDVQVKTSFISTCNSYITLYRALIENMEKYVNYLSSKSDSASALESAFSR